MRSGHDPHLMYPVRENPNAKISSEMCKKFAALRKNGCTQSNEQKRHQTPFIRSAQIESEGRLYGAYSTHRMKN